MNAGATPLFCSSGHRGFSDSVSGDPRHVHAQKREHRVQVRFATAACNVHTNEGEVLAHAGDAILTGIAGEHWRVSRARFGDKYRPVPPTREGEDGAYLSLRNRVLAVRMQTPFEVLLADGQSRLHGRPGDWLLDYGDGSLGIVAQAIFDTTYEITA